jgi:hypothetical protein
MSDQQLDLFAAGGVRAKSQQAQEARRPRVIASELDDATLIATIPGASLADCRALAAEAAQRNLVSAVPALDTLCRRFKGFGLTHRVPEQIATIEALAMLGGQEAAQAIARLIAEQVVDGPGLADAVSAAAKLRVRLPPDTVLTLLRDAEPGIRVDACRCADWCREAIPVLVNLLDDLHGTVAAAAACTLGRMGKREGRLKLTQLLRETPTPEVIESVSPIADEECIVLLGRLARAGSGLAMAAREALSQIDHPRATIIAAAIQVREAG